MPDTWKTPLYYALRKKYRRPGDVCVALGLDAAWLDEDEPETEEEMYDRENNEDDGEAVNRQVAEMLIKCAQMLSHEDTNEDDEDEGEEDGEDEELEAAEDEDDEDTPRASKRPMAADARTLVRFPHADRLAGSREAALMRSWGNQAEPHAAPPAPRRDARNAIAQDNAIDRDDLLRRFPDANRMRRRA